MAATQERAKSARPYKPRAVEMDESLSITQQMREHVEVLTQRHTNALNKMKEHKSTVAKLREQVNQMQSQIEAVQVERATSTKATEEMKGQMEKLENEHAVLQATHTWTKSSLDSARAAQEEYRKGYNSLRAAFKKAKEDIEKANVMFEENKGAHGELEQARKVFDEKKALWDKELKDVNATMVRIAARHKNNAKSVLERMQETQASGLCNVCFQSWLSISNDVKKSQRAKDDVEAAKNKLKAFQDSKKQEAKAVLDRMNASSDQGLIALMWKQWLTFCADVFKERKDAENMASTMKNQKLEARKRLEANLGSSMKSMQAVVFKNWANMYREEKEEREMKAQAEQFMNDYKRNKKQQNMAVVGRMAQKKENALLAQITLVWKVCIQSDIALRYREAESKKRLDNIDADIQKAKKELEPKQDELEDLQEELAEMRKKNQVMRDELKKIMDLEDYMERIQKEMEDDEDDD
mmetsp:Transcript_120229/g.335430  ORF Transcript_120229/g.335430 Transcript_120229/m.335430 type:complete len:468 (-) Transcript_120229:141-1544(-)